ncbi:beta-ketoacyl synthase N-terminal-like domain-containing protein [Streptomyces sp. NPDC127051]|uniref:type I polyketide synthase n=1 Tax=Streptomyces sp. NPDC127051 TaxID=3347119 RepID=UPI0036563588
MTTPTEPIAIVGMAICLPGAADLSSYWDSLSKGEDPIGDVQAGYHAAGIHRPGSGPESTTSQQHRSTGAPRGLATDLTGRDGASLKFTPAEMALISQEELIAVQVAQAALTDAGQLPLRQSIGVIIGCGGPALFPQPFNSAFHRPPTGDLPSPQAEVRTGLEAPHVLAAQAVSRFPDPAATPASRLISFLTRHLDLRGAAFTVDAGCASSLVAVDQAVAALASGRCDVMLAGGIHHAHRHATEPASAVLAGSSPSQLSRPAQLDGDGPAAGEGASLIVLKRLADAQRDSDRIYAVVRGCGVSGAGGRHANDPSEWTRAHSEAIRQAWHQAGLDPRAPGSLGLLEAHAGGSPAAAAAGLTALADVFSGPSPGGTQPVIGSAKSMTGHATAAAGAAALIKTALAIHHGLLPPTLRCEEPHPALATTRFHAISTAQPWTAHLQPRRGAVSVCATTGVAAHLVLEQAPPADRYAKAGALLSVSEPERVLTLAAPTPGELAEQLCAGDSAVLSLGFLQQPPVGGTRLGIVAPTPQRLALARQIVSQGRPWRGRSDIWFTPSPLLGSGGGGKIAFVFPGLEGTFQPRVSDIAQYFNLPCPPSPAHTDVGDIGRHGVAVVGVGRLLNAALRRMRIIPDAVAGHSIGEWTAMTVGGLYDSDDVDAFIQSIDPDALAVPGLAFAVLGTSAARAQNLIREHGDSSIVISHDNAPNQAIVCGPAGPVDSLAQSLRARGVICRILPFQSGFHTPMLAPFLRPIRQAVQALPLHPPAVSVWSATTASPFASDASEVRNLFIRHLLEPVRFRPLIDAMHTAGYRAFVQVGAGQLSSLIGDILGPRDLPHLAITANSPRRDGLAQLRRVALALWVEGAPISPALPPPGIPHTQPAGISAIPPGTPPSPTAAPAPSESPRRPLRGADSGADSGAPARPHAEFSARLQHHADTSQPSPRQTPALEESAGLFPAAAELSALLRETAETAEALIAAALSPPPTAEDSELVQPAHRSGDGPPASPQVTGAQADCLEHALNKLSAPAEPTGPATPPADHPRATGKHLDVSLENMPYLDDHCFFRQRPGWPEPADRWPVVPATTIVHHLMEAARQTTPGVHPIAVHNSRFDRWVPAAPSRRLAVTATSTVTSPDLIDMSFGEHAHSTVELAPRYPDPPAPWSCDTAGDRAPEITAAELYSKRWMFHGPAFQGITQLIAVGDTHVRGIITTPAAPGGLLDNVGQLIGYWIMATQVTRTVIFPTRIDRIRFFGPSPAPGTRLTCHISITSVTDSGLEANAQLLHNGMVWAEVTRWRNRRFHSHPDTTAADRFPEHNTLSRPQPGGWALLHERWQDLASRDLIMRNHLGSAERADYERQPPRSRRQWLLGRIAAKDAVRHHLWRHSGDPVFPAEVRILNHEGGRPFALGVHDRRLPDIDISLAHRAEAAVAIARPRAPGQAPPGIGIDIEEIAERSQATMAVALSDAERTLLDALCPPDGDSVAKWFTKFWAAKEAVAKAEGTGLRGRPRDFTVNEAASDGLVVTVTAANADRRYQVHCAAVSNPPGLPERHYIVAWTTSPDRTPGESQ